jgi:DNA-binding transcriptional MerR regulator
MTERRYRLVVQQHYRCHGTESLVSLNELARLCRCHPELVERFARYGLIDPVDETSGELLFPRSCVPRLRRALRLRQDLGLNAYSLSLVLDLIDRIEELEAELKHLKR